MAVRGGAQPVHGARGHRTWRVWMIFSPAGGESTAGWVGARQAFGHLDESQLDHRLPRGFRVEPSTDFSRRRMLAGLRATRARPGDPGFLSPTASQPEASAVVGPFRLPLRAASDFHRVPFQPRLPQHQHETQYNLVYGDDRINMRGRLPVPTAYGGGPWMAH